MLQTRFVKPPRVPFDLERESVDYVATRLRIRRRRDVMQDLRTVFGRRPDVATATTAMVIDAGGGAHIDQERRPWAVAIGTLENRHDSSMWRALVRSDRGTRRAQIRAFDHTAGSVRWHQVTPRLGSGLSPIDAANPSPSRPRHLWARDKGYGMGGLAGYIPAAIGGHKVNLAHSGFVFAPSGEAMRRWRGWWRIVRADQWGVFFTGAILGGGLSSRCSRPAARARRRAAAPRSRNT